MIEHDDDEQQLVDADDEGPAEEDYVIADVLRGGYSVERFEHGHIGTFEDRDEADQAIRDDAGDTFRPAVWRLSDHGNYHLVEDFNWND